MRLLKLLTLLCALAALPWLAPAQSRAASVAQFPASLPGDWIFEMSGDAQPQRVRLTLTADSLRGRVYGQPFAATFANNRLSFNVGDYRWRATLRNDTLTGWLGVGTDSSKWTGVRDGRSRTPRSNTLAPTTYAHGVSATDTPALRIVAGDTVSTSTLDAGGWGPGEIGARGNKRDRGGNPLVGPIYVENALPGDVLIVKLHRVRLNRGWAFSGTSLMETAIEPGYAAERKPTPQDDKWRFDTLTNTARLAKPSAALADFTVPLHPFLGVIATAPSADYTPSSRESGSYGGNMENKRLREGATVYLPVRVRGAYLYVGDGHAAQGDGELTGDAMETSLDVTFSVEIERWGFQNLVRAEDDEQIMSVGVGGSLDEAMRRATTDMARWLQDAYKLSSTDAAVVMGFAARYDIPDVVAPGFGVTLRLPKSALRTLKQP